MERLVSVAFAFAVALLTNLVSHAQRIVVNPDFECAASHKLRVDSVIISPGETRLEMTVRIPKGRKYTVSDKIHLLDRVSGQKYLPTGVENVVLGKSARMEDKGEKNFSLIFPPVPDGVRTVDLIEDGWDIYGLRLDGEKVERPQRNTADIESLKATEPHPGVMPPLFEPGNVKIRGKVDGYNPLKCPSAIEMYFFNNPNSNTITHAIPVEADGSFEYECQVGGPVLGNFTLNGAFRAEYWYLEPGGTLSIYFDLDRKLENEATGAKDRYLWFGGSLGEINQGYVERPPMASVTSKYVGKIPPMEIVTQVDSLYARYREKVDRYVSAHPSLHPVARALIGTDTVSSRAYTYLIQDMYLEQMAGRSSASDSLLYAVTPEYFRAFLPNLFNADSTIIVNPDISAITNRLNFSTLIKSLKSPDRGVYKYIEGKPTGLMRVCKDIDRRANFMKDVMGCEDVSLLWQVVSNERLCHSSSTMVVGEVEDAMAVLDSVATITHPGLKKGLKEHYAKLYSQRPYDLPDNDNGRIMSRLIEPYKGKVVVVDFWGTTCGPCRYNIEQWADFRRKYKDHPDFMFLFVTGETESPLGAYEKYVAENLDGQVSLRLSDGEYARLRALFNFSGIPHHVLIDKHGKVVNDDFSLLLEPHVVKVLGKLGVNFD